MTYSGPVETKTMTLRSVSPVYHDIFFHIISVFSTKTLKKNCPKMEKFPVCVFGCGCSGTRTQDLLSVRQPCQAAGITF